MSKKTAYVLIAIFAILTVVCAIVMILFLTRSKNSVDAETSIPSETALTENPVDESTEMPEHKEVMFTDDQIVDGFSETVTETDEMLISSNNVTVNVDLKTCLPEGYYDLIKDEVYGDALLADLNKVYQFTEMIYIESAEFSNSSNFATLIYSIKDSDAVFIYEAPNGDWSLEPYVAYKYGEGFPIVFDNGVPSNNDELNVMMVLSDIEIPYGLLRSDYVEGDAELRIRDSANTIYTFQL